MNAYTIETLSPYGIIVQNSKEGQSIECFARQQIYDWIQEHRIIVFRGFPILPKKQFALYAQKIGQPLQWAFGAINELKVKPEIKNYIYTDREVPLHWDGAFVGKIPFIILFQCLTAPRPEDKGGTTFSDTIGLLNNAGADKIKEWRKIAITYTTEKVAHYGGRITQRLIAPHPVTGQETIRYAEPVTTDLNPVALHVAGLEGQTQPEFEQQMRQLLYDPAYLYVHHWQNGDIVMADNHALVHGREAFLNPHERHIQRINILHRPEKLSFSRFIKLSLAIRRKEFFVAELPIFFIPVLLGIADWNTLQNPNLYIGIVAGFLLFNIGDMLNCYADYELDVIYKTHLSNAVYELGKRNVLIQIALTAFLAFALTCYLAVVSGQLYLIPLTLVGGFIGAQYSIRPFHFKTRGLWQLLCLWGIIFWGPMVYISIVTEGFPSLLRLLLFAAYGFHQMGVIMLNTAEDYTEDRQAGLRTVIVALGLHRSMRFAWGLILASGLLMQGCFGVLYHAYALPWYAYCAILGFTASWLYILQGFRIIIRKIQDLDEDKATTELKKNGMKVPEWLKLAAYASLGVAGVLFLFRLFAAHS